MPYQVVGIHHVQLAMPPGEEEAGRRFYGGLLGLEEVPKPADLAGRGGAWFRSDAAEVHLGVEQEDFRPSRKAHPALLVTGLDGLRTSLESVGWPIEEDVQLEGFKRIYVRDPFGNRIELLERA